MPKDVASGIPEGVLWDPRRSEMTTEYRTHQGTIVAGDDTIVAGDELQSDAFKAYRSILNEILSGDLVPTEKQPASEIDIANRYGWSRTPVRMGLARLAAEGLITQRARHGFWVVEYEPNDLLQIAGMRADADAMAASAFSSRLASGVLQSSDSNVEAMDAATLRIRQIVDAFDSDRTDALPRDSENAFANADTMFHMSIAFSTGYDLAARHIYQWRNLLRLYRILHEKHYTLDELINIRNEHDEIFVAMEMLAKEPSDQAMAELERAVSQHAAAAIG